MFTKREKKHIIISILVLGFAFGFNDKQQTFSLASWLLNFLRAIISASIVILLYELAHKFVAKRYGAETEYEVWSIKGYGLWRQVSLPKKIFGYTIESFPLGIILSLITTLLSNGLFYIIPLSSFRIIEKPYLRAGAKFKHLTNFEEAKISAASIILLSIMAIILSSLGSPSIFGMLASMLFIFVLYSLIPFSTLDGSRIFFGSVPLYLAVLAFVVISYLVAAQISILQSLVLSLLGAGIATFLYLYNKA